MMLCKSKAQKWVSPVPNKLSMNIFCLNPLRKRSEWKKYREKVNERWRVESGIESTHMEQDEEEGKKGQHTPREAEWVEDNF